MAFELKQHCTFTGPALPEPFVQFELEKELTKANLLPKVTGKEGQTLQESWEIYRRKLRELVSQGGAIRVRNHVIEPLLERLGYAQLEAVPEVETREGREAGGYLLTTADGASKLRVWCTDFNTDLDAPAKRGAAYRYSHLRIAQRVLLACGERLGLLTNGVELRLLISDPARPDSQVTIAIDPNWKRSRNVPDSYRLVLALASPAGVKALPDLVDKARLQQARVTKELRVQARLAVERFIQEVLDQPANRESLAGIREQGAGGREQDGGQELQGSESLAEGDGSGRSVLSDYETVTQQRDLRSGQPNSESSGIYSSEYSRGQWAGASKGIPASSINSEWLPDGVGNPSAYSGTPELSEQGGSSESFSINSRSGSNAERIEKEAQGAGDREQGIGNSTDPRSLTPDTLAKQLWREGLIIVYRLLFVLKLEASDDVARSFSFASTSLWRNSFSPSMALTRYVRKVLDEGAETGGLLEDGLRTLFRMFTEGVQCTELNVKPLGGALFGTGATPILSQLRWGEQAVAKLLDQLLWTSPRRSGGTRERVHYGPLDVEDLGRVYEALLELEPGISTEPMCRLRRQKLEVVVPAAQGVKYRPANPQPLEVQELAAAQKAEAEEELEEEEDEAPKRGKKTKVEWIEEIPPGRFYLRVGLGRKASGSYYTPHSFVRFLVQETLGPQVAERSPKEDPNPLAILKLKVLDPAMGSGHFLVEACRFLGDKLYEACRLCDEKVIEAEKQLERKGSREQGAGRREQERDKSDPRSLIPAPRSLTPAEIAQLYRQRIIDLPDPDDKLMKYLPSSAPEGKESGFSQQEAIALCRRLVAVHCLYGVDKNPLAVELAKLSLWIESHAEGLPLTFLDHRLVLGDSLTGPFFEHLFKEPASGDDVQKLIQQDVNKQFRETLTTALRYVRELEASVGTDLSDIEAKQTAKRNLDCALAPFKILAAAWSGGVMLGDESGDTDYASLFSTIAETGDLPEDLSDKPKLLAMIAKGLGVEEVPGDRVRVLQLLESLQCVPALSYDLNFAEVFYPDGDLVNLQGFDSILGNPPWDTVRRADDQFFGSYDFQAISGLKKLEKRSIQERLLKSPEIHFEYFKYVESFKEFDRVSDALFSVHKARVAGQLAGRGTYDAYMLFAERAYQLLRIMGSVGWVLPSAFHANEGATGVRRLYFEKMTLKCCFSFENRKQLFEIHRSFKFAPIVASKSGTTIEFPCAFYIHDDEWLFNRKSEQLFLKYPLDFVRKTGGEYLNLMELRSEKDLEIAKICFRDSQFFGDKCNSLNIQFSQEVNMTYDDWRFVPIEEVSKNSDICASNKELLEQGYLILHEGKTLHQYTDQWENQPKFLIHISKVTDKSSWTEAAKFYRLAFRAIQNAENERTLILTLMPPGVLFGHSVSCDRNPRNVVNVQRLKLQALTSAFTCDWLLRLKATANISLFIINNCPLPITPREADKFLAHSALRLTCNHFGYEPLWREQLSDEWREPDKSPFTFPVLATDDDRWSVRAAIDAVVAQAYGLDRDQYAHVLSTFSHKSYPKAPQLCLDRFDELEAIGLEAFTQKYDPYWDIPLNENLPQPVIDLPISQELNNFGQQALELNSNVVNKEQKSRKKK